MKKFFSVALAFMIMILLTACGDDSPKTQSTAQVNSSTENKVDENKPATSHKNLIVYFSRTGENYEVGVIDKGNTHIVADFIAENIQADMFELKPATPYPKDYRDCTDVAKHEKEGDARPAFIGKIEDFDTYDTIYLGYPNWYSDMPMIIYTFLENYDFSGKTIIPFCTSSSEAFIGKEEIEQYAKGSTVLEGLGIRGKYCQENPDNVKSEVKDWLKRLGRI